MTKIKICGLFREVDIDAVNESVPDFIGFVYAKSRRQVTVGQSRQLRRRLDPSITPVGVFVDDTVEQIATLHEAGIISLAQLHGQEDEAFVRALKKRCPIQVIKAIRVQDPSDILAWESSAADYLLLDNGPGGTGQSFDWQLIPAVGKPYFLAGGVGEHNIDAALALDPWCIDISSGAETAGVKDKDKIRRLVGRVRSHDPDSGRIQQADRMSNRDIP